MAQVEAERHTEPTLLKKGTLMKLELILDGHNLEIITDYHAYLEDPDTELYRPWNADDNDAGPLLTPELQKELQQIMKEAETLFSKAKAILTTP